MFVLISAMHKVSKSVIVSGCNYIIQEGPAESHQIQFKWWCNLEDKYLSKYLAQENTKNLGLEGVGWI